MADKEQIIKEKVSNSGYFDFTGLYSYAHSWFKDEGYGVDEEKYTEKVKGSSRDINIEWKATKKQSDYFKFEYSIKFEIKELTEVEVETDGKKKKMNKGSLEIEVKGVLIKDYDSKWESSPFNKFMRDVYNKYVIPSRVNDMKDRVANDVKNFKEEIKAYLELTGRR
jgi:hypothetical protein